MSSFKKKILITGASGFIGKNLLPSFSTDHYEIRLLTRNPANLTSDIRNLSLAGDLSDTGSYIRDIAEFNPDICIHLAWEGIPDFSFDMCWKNLGNSIEFFQTLFKHTDCSKIIVSGSCFEYSKESGVCNESDHCAADSDFAWAKHSLYSFLNYECLKDHKELIWFRIFFVYGPGQREESLVPFIINSFGLNETVILKSPFNTQDFIYIQDVVDAIKNSVDKEIESGIYNLGTGLGVNVYSICKIAASILDTGHLLPDVENEQKDKTLTSQNFWADMEKTCLALQWKPSVSLQDGIRAYVEYRKTM